ncbi:MAG: biotin/lipoyl-containing protein [Anaerolineales bacterium]
MSIYRVTVAGKEYTVEVPNSRERPVRAIVDGEEIEVHVASQPGATAPKVTAPPKSVDAAPSAPSQLAPSAPAAPAAGGDIRSPLPGVVVSISVSQGDQVEPGQELCVLEAMKMNNPIRATQTGVVKEIYIRIGQKVQHGDPLLRIEG